jgi:dTMP kinase
MSAKWIVLEGGDAVGKSSLINNIKKNWDVDANGPLKSFFDPGIEEGHPMGVIRTLVKTANISPETEVLLFQACRLELANSIMDTLNMGINVLCDRWVTSNIVYQAKMKGMEDLVMILNDVFQLEQPDATFVLNAPFETLTKRLESRFATDSPNRDKFKKNEFFRRRVWAEYGKLLKDDPSLIELDSTGTPEDTLEEFFRILRMKNMYN